MSGEEKPKIIVDDDWKSRVQAEKESLKGGPAPESPPQDKPEVRDDVSPDDQPLPPATFESLVSMLVTQTLVALGQIPIGDERKPVIMLNHAKHYIDLLGVIEEKTKGNLTPDEAHMMENLLHELRMAFVAVKKSAS